MVEHPDVTKQVLDGIQAAMPDTVVPIREPRVVTDSPVTMPVELAESADLPEDALSTQNSN
jgi:hypothetical protein